MSKNMETTLSAFCSRKTTVYINWRTEGVFIKGKNLILVSAGSAETILPMDGVRRLVLIGKPAISSLIIYQLMRKAIPIDWLDVFGHPAGQITRFEESGHFRIKYQAKFANSERAFQLAKLLLLAKVDNCHEIIRRKITIGTHWKENRIGLSHADNSASLRGCEGACAREYFSCWQGLLHRFEWQGRHARPAPDPVNMLLSLGYSLLYYRLASALNNVGLNPRLGFFHEERGTHSALASDLMEPLRALVDARVLSMIRREEVNPEDFRTHGGNCVCAKRDKFTKILAGFEDMFDTAHKFYISPDNPENVVHRTLNDILDDMAASYAEHIMDGGDCIIPRLAPCASI